MAAKYGVLPTKIIQEGTTYDIKIHMMSEIYKERERSKARGDNKATAQSYTQAEIDEVYKNWRKGSQ